MVKHLTISELIDKANIKHDNKYFYSLSGIKNSKDKIKITCKTHGVFEQRIDHHLNGSGCPKCIGRNKNLSELINKYRLIHGDKYDYSLVDYQNAKNKIKIICPKHHIFEITSRQHLKGVNCSKCERERISKNQRKTTEEFIIKAKLTHGDEYNYSLVNYIKAAEKVDIVCYKHGSFKQTPRTHISGAGCPICKSSKGEKEIRRYLEAKNIKFTPQYKFKNCKHIRPLPFDFYLPDYNICIEYHGEQHYLNKKFFGGGEKLIYIQNNDKIKTQYCLNNNITLCTIPYKEFNNIKTLLDSYITTR